jgi:hypothetical protein
MTGAESAPLLGPILIACGIGDLTNWHNRDAAAYPLNRRSLRHRADLACRKTGIRRGPTRTRATTCDHRHHFPSTTVIC